MFPETTDFSRCVVHLDDILAALVSAAEAYVANKKPMGIYQEMEED